MSMLSSFVNWIIKTGVKFITSLLRTAVQLSGVPNARLPTERDVLCEVGGTLIKSVLKAKAKQKMHGFAQRFMLPVWGMLPLKSKVQLPHKQMPIIDI